MERLSWTSAGGQLPWENKHGVGSQTAEQGATGTPVALP